jgi:hypothetical protein
MKNAGAVGAILEDAQIQHGILCNQCVNHKQDQSRSGSHRKRTDQIRIEPILRLALVEKELQRSNA